jgi:hypothetical protein
MKYIFIIPYRDREKQKHFFDNYIKYLLEDYDLDSYEIIFAHQKNNLPFNRGGMKNCGFLYAKNKYPDTYKELIFIFNDIDTLPYKKNLLNYDLEPNEIKHFYGFDFCLGGITAIRGSDFEKINGFPSLWYWGWEDTVLYERAKASHIKINRDNFYRFGDSHILHLMDGVQKNYSDIMYQKYKNKTILDGLSNIKNLNYNMNELLDIGHFECSYSPIDNSIKTLTLQNSQVPAQKKTNKITMKFL